MSCLICSEAMDDPSTIVRIGKIGLASLVKASIIRRDGLGASFNSAEDLMLHIKCRKDYTHPSELEKITREFEAAEGEFLLTTVGTRIGCVNKYSKTVVRFTHCKLKRAIHDPHTKNV